MTKYFDLHYINTSFGRNVKTVRHLAATNFDDAMTEAYFAIKYTKGHSYELYRNGKFFIDFI